MTAFYNEIDPYAAQWLRNLIAAGHIASGVVDERSIEDVTPDDLRGFTQCHFFAGIGVWSYALRAAGWPDDRPVWTGSAPCQPFSAAGAGAGFADERHLWPAFHHLIAECEPPTVLGEQVASSAVDDWIDLVHADLEAVGYAFGSVPFPSAGVGAPHIRDRNYWMAHADGGRRQQLPRHGRSTGLQPTPHGTPERIGQPSDMRTGTGRLADADGGHASAERQQRGGQQRQQPEDGGARGLADATGARWRPERPNLDATHGVGAVRAGEAQSGRRCAVGGDAAGPTNGFWRDADWLGCTDGRWRPVEPGTFPLVAGTAGGVGRVRADQERLAALVPRKDQGSRIGRLRGYGNAINAEAARVFIECVMECMP